MKTADTTAFIFEYLAAIESGATGDSLRRFFTSDAVQEEFPNRLVPNGAIRDLDGILESAERGRQILQGQKFEVHNIIADGSNIAVEVTWVGILAVGIGKLVAGDAMRARFCMAIELDGLRICRQRNYDCFESF